MTPRKYLIGSLPPEELRFADFKWLLKPTFLGGGEISVSLSIWHSPKAYQRKKYTQ